MSDVQINNKVFLSGKVITNPVFTHEVMGEGFYEVMLAVKRMSEQEDVIPVTLSERLMIDNEIRVGDTLSVDGQFRSYNKYENGKSRLMLTVFTREIADLQATFASPPYIARLRSSAKYATCLSRSTALTTNPTISRALPGAGTRALREVWKWAIKSPCRGAYKAGNTRKTSTAILS